MSNIEIRFKCKSELKDFIKIERGTNNDIVIITSHNESVNLILMDKSTAIRFAKTLRTEINKITESEVNNG
jgi:hypothetical protein